MRIGAKRSVAGAALVAATVAAAWSMTYARGHAAPAPPTTPASTVAPSQTTDLAEMGATYYWLEARGRRVRTRFRDGSAVAERGPDGDIDTRLFDGVGNEVAALKVDRVARGQTRLELTNGADRISAAARPDVVPTLEWANLQARALVKDGATASTPMEWRGRFTRTRDGARDAIEDAPLEIAVEFDSGVTATTVRNDRDLKIGTKLRRPTLVTHVTADGADVGAIRWYEKEQILAFDFPGLTSDVFTPDTLKPIGGWTFRPTMAWANVQGLAFYDFHRRLKSLGPQAAKSPERSGIWQALYETFVPTLHANDPGCDYLHWLDTSVFRPCCDQHDRCYNQDSQVCQSKSWFWPFASNWQCESCNISAVWCFAGVTSTCIEVPGACIEYQY